MRQTSVCGTWFSISNFSDEKCARRPDVSAEVSSISVRKSEAELFSGLDLLSTRFCSGPFSCGVTCIT